jgi:hypothetical protein
MINYLKLEDVRELKCEKTKVMRISRHPSPKQIITHQKQLYG